MTNSALTVEFIDIDEISDHPKNYKHHPDDQIEHIISSIKQNGIYKNVVISKDKKILCGHGVVKAARKIGIKEIPVVRLGINSDSTEAIRLIVGDNEISHLAETDDIQLSELMKHVLDMSGALDGTGYDENMLSALLINTRHAEEIQKKEDADHWVGMPEYKEEEIEHLLNIRFSSNESRNEFCKKNDIDVRKVSNRVWSANL